MRIFVVEDQKIILQGIVKMIEGFGPDEVLPYADAAQALADMPRLRPEVVFTDIVMEGMDGLTMIREASQLLPECRFVIISGFADFEYARQAISLGVDSYLLKPIERTQLEGILAKLRGPAEPKSRRPSLSQEVMEVIRKHCDMPLSIADIAASVHITPNYLSNVFKKETGISISTAIRNAQMNEAARLLRTTDLYLYEVAERFGYKDVKYFSVLFKGHHRMTPKNYRKKHNEESPHEQED